MSGAALDDVWGPGLVSGAALDAVQGLGLVSDSLGCCPGPGAGVWQPWMISGARS